MGAVAGHRLEAQTKTLLGLRAGRCVASAAVAAALALWSPDPVGAARMGDARMLGSGRDFRRVCERLFHSSAVLRRTGLLFIHLLPHSFFPQTLTDRSLGGRALGMPRGVTTAMGLRGSHFAGEDGQLIAQLTN